MEHLTGKLHSTNQNYSKKKYVGRCTNTRCPMGGRADVELPMPTEGNYINLTWCIECMDSIHGPIELERLYEQDNRAQGEEEERKFQNMMKTMEEGSNTHCLSCNRHGHPVFTVCKGLICFEASNDRPYKLCRSCLDQYLTIHLPWRFGPCHVSPSVHGVPSWRKYPPLRMSLPLCYVCHATSNEFYIHRIVYRRGIKELPIPACEKCHNTLRWNKGSLTIGVHPRFLEYRPNEVEYGLEEKPIQLSRRTVDKACMTVSYPYKPIELPKRISESELVEECGSIQNPLCPTCRDPKFPILFGTCLKCQRDVQTL